MTIGDNGAESVLDAAKEDSGAENADGQLDSASPTSSDDLVVLDVLWKYVCVINYV